MTINEADRAQVRLETLREIVHLCGVKTRQLSKGRGGYMNRGFVTGVHLIQAEVQKMVHDMEKQGETNDQSNA